MTSEVEIFRTFIAAEKDYALGQPTDEQEIANFETKYKVRLPNDVKEYFLKINGASMHGGFIALEPLDQWGLMAEWQFGGAKIDKWIPEVNKYFRFGNYDISVWHWIIKLDSDPNAETPVFVLYENFTQIADSFSNFLQKFRTESAEDLLGYS